MIGGQVCDLEGEGQHPDAALLEAIHRAKTGALLRASLRMGAHLCGRRSRATARALLLRRTRRPGVSDRRRRAGRGAVFRSPGKTAGKDAQQHKITFPAVYGLERSREMAEEERLAAHLALRPFDERAERLRELADFIVHRRA